MPDRWNDTFRYLLLAENFWTLFFWFQKDQLLKISIWTTILGTNASFVPFLIQFLSCYRQISLYYNTMYVSMFTGSEFFKAHKDVLCAASDYFSAMFSHDMAEKDKDYIELQGISLEGFQNMLGYFYHGHITLVNENVQHCLEAGSYFHVRSISFLYYWHMRQTGNVCQLQTKEARM